MANSGHYHSKIDSHWRVSSKIIPEEETTKFRTSNRAVAFLMAIGSILYAIAALSASETVLGPLEQMLGVEIRSIFIITLTIVRIGSLIMMALSATKLHI